MSAPLPRLHAKLLGLMWAVGHLAHALRKEPINDSLSWLLLLTCVVLLLRPASPVRLGWLCLAQLVVFVDRMPRTDNHMYILAFVNAGLLAVVIPLVLRRSGWTDTAFGLARNYTALVFLMAYAAAALSKLNRDFLFSEASCSLTMLDDAASAVGLDRTVLPEVLLGGIPFLVAGVELAIPLLLLMPRTRPAGIVLAVLFHLAISISPTATAIDFTLIIFAVLALLVPMRGRLAEAATKVLSLRTYSRALLDRATVGVLGLFFVLVAFVWRLGTVAGNRSWMLLAAVALPLGAVLVLVALRWWDADGFRVSLARLSPVHYPLLVLLLANIASPYLGWKTAGTFTMYSNLNTYDQSSNHYLFPRAKAPTLHDDFVEIIDSSNERLRTYRDRGHLITWHQFRVELARDPEGSVAYVRDGQAYHLARAADLGDEALPHPVLRKLVAHRPHPVEQTACLW